VSSLDGNLLVASNAELEFSDTALESNEVLLQLGLFLLEGTNLVLQFHILNLLTVKVLLQVTLNPKQQSRVSLADEEMMLTWWLQAGGSCGLRWTCGRGRFPTAPSLGEAFEPHAC
jgi:hypothetical protein